MSKRVSFCSSVKQSAEESYNPSLSESEESPKWQNKMRLEDLHNPFVAAIYI